MQRALLFHPVLLGISETSQRLPGEISGALGYSSGTLVSSSRLVLPYSLPESVAPGILLLVWLSCFLSIVSGFVPAVVCIRISLLFKMVCPSPLLHRGAFLSSLRPFIPSRGGGSYYSWIAAEETSPVASGPHRDQHTGSRCGPWCFRWSTAVMGRALWACTWQSGRWRWRGDRRPPDRENRSRDMRNAGLEEAQAGIKIAGRNINNLRYTDDTTLMEKRQH